MPVYVGANLAPASDGVYEENITFLEHVLEHPEITDTAENYFDALHPRVFSMVMDRAEQRHEDASLLTVPTYSMEYVIGALEEQRDERGYGGEKRGFGVKYRNAFDQGYTRGQSLDECDIPTDADKRTFRAAYQDAVDEVRGTVDRDVKVVGVLSLPTGATLGLAADSTVPLGIALGAAAIEGSITLKAYHDMAYAQGLEKAVDDRYYKHAAENAVEEHGDATILVR